MIKLFTSNILELKESLIIISIASFNIFKNSKIYWMYFFYCVNFELELRNRWCNLSLIDNGESRDSPGDCRRRNNPRGSSRIASWTSWHQVLWNRGKRFFLNGQPRNIYLHAFKHTFTQKHLNMKHIFFVLLPEVVIENRYTFPSSNFERSFRYFLSKPLFLLLVQVSFGYLPKKYNTKITVLGRIGYVRNNMTKEFQIQKENFQIF